MQLVMSLSYSQCKAAINAATESNHHVNDLAVEAFRKSITAVALAIFWLMKQPSTGSKQEILQVLKAINKPNVFYQIDFTDTSFVEESNDFMAMDDDSAELKFFAEHVVLEKPKYCLWFVKLVTLIKDCNEMMENYKRRVSNPIVFSKQFGSTEIVIGIVKKSLEQALVDDHAGDDVIVISDSEND